MKDRDGSMMSWLPLYRPTEGRRRTTWAEVKKGIEVQARLQLAALRMFKNVRGRYMRAGDRGACHDDQAAKGRGRLENSGTSPETRDLLNDASRDVISP